MSTNLGKVTRYVAHASRDDCVCPSCRKARIHEQRSMDPLSFWDKVWIVAGTLAALGIGALFAGAAWVSWGPQ